MTKTIQHALTEDQLVKESRSPEISKKQQNVWSHYCNCCNYETFLLGLWYFGLPGVAGWQHSELCHKDRGKWWNLLRTEFCFYLPQILVVRPGPAPSSSSFTWCPTPPNRPPSCSSGSWLSFQLLNAHKHLDKSPDWNRRGNNDKELFWIDCFTLIATWRFIDERVHIYNYLEWIETPLAL